MPCLYSTNNYGKSILGPWYQPWRQKKQSANGSNQYRRKDREGDFPIFFYETEPWGFKSDNSFLNAALCVETSLEPSAILHIIKEIEIEMGRIQKSVNKVYSDRPIDIDILLYNDMIMKSDELTIPHPLMTERDFVMKPLVEIAGDTVHPVLRRD